jgi:hypothetical protein
LNTTNFIARVLPVLALAAMPHIVSAQHPGTSDVTAAQAATYQDAVKAFREQRYPAAYARFARLADTGHVPSAEVALMMHRNSASLFQNAWYASLDQQRGWNALVINASRGRMYQVEPGSD